MKRTKILGNTFISIGVLLALARVMFAGAGDGVPSLGDMPLRGHPPTYTNIDPPGSVATLPFCINPAGVIAGEYFDASFVPHGFVRARDGTFSTFEAPAGAIVIDPISINPPGVIVGSYLDASNVWHGFLRTRKDTITTFDAPGAGTAPFQGTQSENINPGGVISGLYIDSNS